MRIVINDALRLDSFGIVGPVTGNRYRFAKGKETNVDDSDGDMMLQQYPGAFLEVKPTAEGPESKQALAQAPDEQDAPKSATKVGSRVNGALRRPALPTAQAPAPSPPPEETGPKGE